MSTSVTFEDEFEKLLKVLKEVSFNYAKLHRAVTNYETAYGKTIPERHIEYFKAIYNEEAVAIASELVPGQWLEARDQTIVFGKGKGGAALPLSDLYIKAKDRAANYTYQPGKELVPLYPKIILLHLYRIFNVIEPTGGLERKILLLEQDLRGANQPSNWLEGFQNFVGPMVNTLRANFTGASAEQNKTIDAMMDIVKSPEIGAAASQVSGSMQDLWNQVPQLLPKVMEVVGNVQSGKTDFTKGVTDFLSDPVLQGHLSKLDGIKPLLSKAASIMEKEGVEIPEAMRGDISNTSVSDLFKTVLASPDAQQEITKLNDTATSMIRDPSQLAKLTQMGQDNLMQLAAPRPDLALPTASGGSHAAMPNTSAPPTVDQAKALLSQLPPDQIAALLKQLNM